MKIIGKHEQGSLEWFRARRGMLTASEFGKILTARDFTLNKLRAEKLAELQGAIPPEIHGRALEWGKLHEPQARANLELLLDERGFLGDETIAVPGLVVHDEMIWLGFSADGLILSREIGVELKCPFNESVHLSHWEKHDHDTAWRQGIPKQYFPQVQGGMMVTGWKKWIYASFDPRRLEDRPDHAIYATVVERDDIYIQRMKEKLVRFWKSLGIKKADLEALRA